ncbi:MAG TPA: glucoamylase family protein, partial [Saprospiraceae bacterium]
MAFFRIGIVVWINLLLHHVQAQEINLVLTGYDMHTELNWEAVTGADRYQVWRKRDSETDYTLLTTTRKLRRIDWTGRESEETFGYAYYIDALSLLGNILTTSDTVETEVMPFSDEQFLDMVQEYTLRYFYEYGHPTSGMARERLGSDDIVTTGGTGFGIMALIVGVHRGYITREEAVNRLLKIVGFLQFADRFHGVYSHWMNGQTGEVIPFSTFDNGGDLVETAFLMQGLLAARQYFNQDIPKEDALRDVITSLWEDVEWDFYDRNNSGVLYWHWSPEYEWQMNFPIRGYNEALIVYLLAIASPTHPVNASYYHSGWAGSGYVNGHTWYGHKLFVGPNLGGPLFFAHYSFLGFDPRQIKDDYANYFEQNRNHTLINHDWCADNPFNHEGYSGVCWGLTASDDPFGYSAHAPGSPADNGTITPAAAIPSMPYTPVQSIDALKHFYRDHGPELWGEYGFYDAFNLNEDWFADSYLAIDQGPIIDMIENYRSGLLWSVFMSNPEIAPALEAIGFVEDPVSTNESSYSALDIKVYPTMTNGDLY